MQIKLSRSMWMFFALMIIAIFFILVMKQGSFVVNSFSSKAEQQSIQEIVRLIDSTPTWDEIPTEEFAINNGQVWGKIKGNYLQIAKYDVGTIRNGILSYIKEKKVSKEYDIRCMSRLLILNRFLFNVPDNNIVAFPIFGGWIAEKGNSPSILWPLAVNNNGEIIPKSRIFLYSGPDFRAIQEFDYFYDNFGLRPLSKGN